METGDTGEAGVQGLRRVRVGPKSPNEAKKVFIIIGLAGCHGRRKAVVEAGFGHAAGTGVPIDDLGCDSLPRAMIWEAAGRNVYFSYPKVGQSTS